MRNGRGSFPISLRLQKPANISVHIVLYYIMIELNLKFESVQN